MNIETRSGLFFDYSDPQPEQVVIEDVAHALSLTTRYGGHCRRFYSVAEHAVLVSRLCHPEMALEGLHHDSHEAYLGDIPSPLKAMLGDTFTDLADNVDSAIVKTFGLEWAAMDSADIHDADRLALRIEARDLKASQGAGPHWGYDAPIEGYAGLIHCWSPAAAKTYFLARHKELSR